jgi:outer membrane lipoprotein carrier protein
LSTRSFAVAALAALSPAFAAQEVDLTRRVSALESRYKTVQSVSAHFTQIYRAPGIEQVESGILYMKKPGLMRWEYRAPETKLFIVDGRSSYLYVPEDRQVTVHPFRSSDLRSTPFRFLFGQGEISRSFEVSREREFSPSSTGTFLLRLEPKIEEPEYAYFVIECDSSTNDLKRLVVRERTGNLSEFHLERL